MQKKEIERKSMKKKYTYMEQYIPYLWFFFVIT